MEIKRRAWKGVECTNEGEVSEHLIKLSLSKGASDVVYLVHRFLLVVSFELLVDPGALDQCLEDVEHRVDRPHILFHRVRDQRDLLGRLRLQLGAVLRVVLELIDKLVNNIPQPLVGQLEVDGRLVLWVNDKVEHLTVVVERVRPVLVGWPV